MAVYKATYCQPLLKNIDIRVAIDSEETEPCEWLTCKINSSNKKITGYKVRILDSANNQIFPSPLSNEGNGYISKIQDLWYTYSEEEQPCSFDEFGYNGTIIKIPFFQNYNIDSMRQRSLNAVYYVPQYKADSYPVLPVHLHAIDENNISLTSDGPTLMSAVFPGGMGKTVLIFTDATGEDSLVCERGIFKFISSEVYYVPYPKTRIYLERVMGVNTDALKEHEVVITWGDNHDKIFYFDEDGNASEVTDHTGAWVDFAGNPINFDINGGSYKWEITFYQGDYEEDVVVIPGPGGVEHHLTYLDYSSLGFEWFDTVLNSGKILGSTNKRIQIASSLGDDAILPIGTLNSPLVLQGTYAQLFDSDGNPLASRAYVQNYDTTFGHVYPINGGFSREIIDSAEKVCFYKHSNNVEDVLAGERVVCATTPSDGNLEIYRQVGGRWEGNPNLGLPTIDGIQLKEGDTVLVKDQDRQRENGVYIAHESGTAWSRSASYKNWGSFIGAILFVINGNINGGTNWESTATAGGSLFDTTTASGESPLIFILETPIPLFVENIKKSVELTREKMPHEVVNPSLGDEVSQDGDTYQVKLYIRKRAESFDDPGRALSDGVVFAPGQHVLCYNSSHAIIEVVEFGRTLEQNFDSYMTIKYNIIETVDIGDYLNVITGERYGGHVVEITSDSMEEADDQVKKAYILKNGVDHTYISPYVGLKEDMALKLLHNKKVTYSDDSVSQWIRIHAEANSALKSINTTVWRISHATLAEPLLSDSASDPNVPFTYELRTYYRTSDENPFFTFEQPRVGITLDAALRSEEGYIRSKKIVVSGNYTQFQQISWSSYRWVLLDNENKVVQDTGLKYDRVIKATFDGLSNEPPLNQYKIMLYVTDATGEVLSAEREITVQAASSSSGIVLSANFDCSTHSIKLAFQPESEEKYSIYRRECQIYERSVCTSEGEHVIETKQVQGQWEPVALSMNQAKIRDFNIKAGHSYQYIIYKGYETAFNNAFANATERGPYAGSAVPIVTNWDEWSLIELKPVQNAVDAPILRKSYEVDLDNIWLFKYGLETGSQNQNFQKSEIQTLGQYQKIGYGKSNFISGDVSCYLGSEIVPYSKNGYIERMRKSINTPLSTNERALMLKQWRKIASSPNPKLLRDMKGQSWIVQIMSNNNTPKNFYSDQPDTISFSWKQIDNTDNVIIVGDGTELPEVGVVDSVWKKVL